MLFMFESTMAKSRLRTLTELRRVRVDNQIVMVHRGGKYVISTLASLFLGLMHCDFNAFLYIVFFIDG